MFDVLVKTVSESAVAIIGCSNDVIIFWLMLKVTYVFYWVIMQIINGIVISSGVKLLSFIML
jgi:hypothetical protein